MVSRSVPEEAVVCLMGLRTPNEHSLGSSASQFENNKLEGICSAGKGAWVSLKGLEQSGPKTILNSKASRTELHTEKKLLIESKLSRRGGGSH